MVTPNSIMDAINKNRKAGSVEPKAAGHKKEMSPAKVPTKSKSNHNFIREASIGDKLSGIYAVMSVQDKMTKTNKPYSDIEMADKSGSMQVRMWDIHASACVAKGDWAEIEANVGEYQGVTQIVASVMTRVSSPGDMTNYAPCSDTIDEDIEAITSAITSIEVLEGDDKTCSLIVNRIAQDIDWHNPASTKPCYGKIGGLALKTRRVIRLAHSSTESYGLNNIETAIVLASAVTHAIGCVKAFALEGYLPTETKHGMLFGAGFLSTTKVAEAVRESANMDGFVVDTALRLVHAVLAANGCGKDPMTKEAAIITSAVKVDSETSQACDYIDADVNDSEEFTSFDPVLGRRYLRGKSQQA